MRELADGTLCGHEAAGADLAEHVVAEVDDTAEDLDDVACGQRRANVEDEVLAVVEARLEELGAVVARPLQADLREPAAPVNLDAIEPVVAAGVAGEIGERTRIGSQRRVRHVDRELAAGDLDGLERGPDGLGRRRAGRQDAGQRRKLHLRDQLRSRGRVRRAQSLLPNAGILDGGDVALPQLEVGDDASAGTKAAGGEQSFQRRPRLRALAPREAGRIGKRDGRELTTALGVGDEPVDVVAAGRDPEGRLVVRHLVLLEQEQPDLIAGRDPDLERIERRGPCSELDALGGVGGLGGKAHGDAVDLDRRRGIDAGPECGAGRAGDGIERLQERQRYPSRNIRGRQIQGRIPRGEAEAVVDPGVGRALGDRQTVLHLGEDGQQAAWRDEEAEVGAASGAAQPARRGTDLAQHGVDHRGEIAVEHRAPHLQEDPPVVPAALTVWFVAARVVAVHRSPLSRS